tara:strand:- start:146 stop:433 length:288 start_codon:yes stop_codon:yes gene_type:complete
MIQDEDEFHFLENGIEKVLYMSWISPECDENGRCQYELRVAACHGQDPFDENDGKNSVSDIGNGLGDCEPYYNKSKCRKRYNELVRIIKKMESKK